MKAIICSSCGASLWQEERNYRICLHCGTKYEKLAEQPVYSVPSSSHKTSARHVESVIEINEDVERLLQKCRKEPSKAKKYANLILDIDPTNEEALKYLNRGV